LAAQTRWPDTPIVATDNCLESVQHMKSLMPAWSVRQCDFLDETARLDIQSVTDHHGGASVILLNPPFSCRGAKRIEASDGETTVFCSTAMAFVITATRYLAADGEMVAILPHGCISNEKDQQARDLLAARGSFTHIRSYRRDAFKGCYPETALIHYSFQSEPQHSPHDLDRTVAAATPVLLTRGTLPMFRVESLQSISGFPLVHTTRIRNGVVSVDGTVRVNHANTFRGPGVLLPRVGVPALGKIAVYADEDPIVLSDCLFGIRCLDYESAEELARLLRFNWTRVDRIYGGTCARFTTIAAVKALLLKLGYLAVDPQFWPLEPTMKTDALLSRVA
jgi:hypothetical protein